MGVLASMLTYVVGFFATAGAAGVDFGLNSRDKKDVSMGGLVGIALAIIVTAGLSLLIVAGAYGSRHARATAAATGKLSLSSFELIPTVLGPDTAKWVMFLLAVAAFPPACFSSFIAANSFKTTLPKVNPFISVGIGTAVSVILAVTGVAGQRHRGVRDHRRLLRSDLRRDDGGLPAHRRQVDRPARGLQPGRLDRLGAGFVVGILPNLRLETRRVPESRRPCWRSLSAPWCISCARRRGCCRP